MHRSSSPLPQSQPSVAAARRTCLAGLVSLALLAFGEAAPAAFPVFVAVDVEETVVRVHMEGAEHVAARAPGLAPGRIELQRPGPAEREYQVDGTDTTATQDRDLDHLQAIEGSWLYRLDAWLRDEGSYSRWERVRVLDATGRQVLAAGRPAVEQLSLPPTFHLEAAFRRPEAAARLWLARDDTRGEGLELNRDRRAARWIERTGQEEVERGRWFFPEDPLPFAAELTHVLGRAVACGFASFLAVALVARMLASFTPRLPMPSAPPRLVWAGVAVLLVAWLVAAGWVTAALYRQLPHVLDAVSYVFQARVLDAGRLWLDAPERVAALEGPFQVVWDGRWFSQYPPGAPAAYALGGLVGLGWLVGPLASLALIAGTAAAGWQLFSPRISLAALVLGALSPFVLFQAGSFLSHPIAGGLLAGALAAFARGERLRAGRWYAWAGLALGAAFATREAATALFALPLLVWLAADRRWRALAALALGAAPALLAYLAYNWALTGDPLVLPRFLFDASDRFGFGYGIGFYDRHTLAAGLANADELLTLLQLDLFGWPPLFAFGLLSLPFLLRRPDRRDALVGGGAALFVVAYVAYFYHGIALGPRYYYEALPWLLLLAARGLQVLVQAVRDTGAAPLATSASVLALVGLLVLNDAAYYLPRQVQRREDFVGLPGGRRMTLPFVRTTPAGARLTGIPEPALVLVDDWWLFNVVLSPLSCARPDQPDPAVCPVLVVHADGTEDERALRAAYPGRTVLRAVDDGRGPRLDPASP